MARKNSKESTGLDMSGLLAIIASSVFTRLNFTKGSAIRLKLLPAAATLAGVVAPPKSARVQVAKGIASAIAAGGELTAEELSYVDENGGFNGVAGFDMYERICDADKSAKERIHASLANWAVETVTDLNSVNAPSAKLSALPPRKVAK